MTFAGLLLFIIAGAFVLDHVWAVAAACLAIAGIVSAAGQRGKRKPRPARQPVERPVPKSDRRTPPRYVLPSRVKHYALIASERRKNR